MLEAEALAELMNLTFEGHYRLTTGEVVELFTFDSHVWVRPVLGDAMLRPSYEGISTKNWLTEMEVLACAAREPADG